MRWTFDPMVARNAWFNLGKLGAVADRFYPDFYGPMTDAINAGERSDRLVIRWDLAARARPAGPGRRRRTHRGPGRPRAAPGRRPGRRDGAARPRCAERIRAATDEGRHGVAFDRDASAYLFAHEEGAS